MDRKRLLYFESLVLLLHICRGIEREDPVNYESLTDNSKYVFHGKAAILHCNVPIKDSEEVKKVTWKFNEKVFLQAINKHQQVKDSSFGGKIDLVNQDPFTIKIKEAHISMSGNYTCLVDYADKNETSTFFLPIINDVCKDSDWKFTLNKESCEQTIDMKCVGVFPKPRPQCQFIGSQVNQGIHVHTEPLENGTFKISINAIYKKKDFENVTELTLNCILILSDTGYQFGIKKEMFGDRGCPLKYPDAGDGYVNDTNIEKSCWDQAANGSSLTYHCSDDRIKTLSCVGDSWVDKSGNVIVSDRSYCTDNGNTMTVSTFSILIAVLMLYYY